ncbi:MAG: hypothetical protein IKF19_03895 [Bacilli bacterium]|nr:hypothetical protein [Bacilli bacterium]
MKNKKYILIILIILVLLLGLGSYYILHSTNTNKKELVNKDNIINDILKKIDINDSFLIYLHKNNCDICSDTNDILDYYKEAYDITIIDTNIDSITNNGYSKLLKKIGATINDFEFPAIIYIKDGEYMGMSNYLSREEELKSFLIDYKYIKEETNNNDYQIYNEEFNNYYKDTKNHLIVLYTYDNPSSYKFRGKVFNLSQKYNFNYSTAYVGTAGTEEIVLSIRKELKDFSVPMMLIVGNNKIIDYVNDTNDIETFLKNNNYINNR